MLIESDPLLPVVPLSEDEPLSSPPLLEPAKPAVPLSRESYSDDEELKEAKTRFQNPDSSYKYFKGYLKSRQFSFQDF
jgi:hypothetical protein